jgi:hypothetical protein
MNPSKLNPEQRASEPDYLRKAKMKRYTESRSASKKSVLLLLVLLGIATITRGERLSISWFTIDGGGGSSSGGGYSVSGTIGQPDAGKMRGANYSLLGGFWAVIKGGPPLKIRQQADSLVLSWPADAIGFTVQSATQLTAGGGNWTDLPTDPVLVGDEFQVVIGPSNTPPNPIRFFRLRHP